MSARLELESSKPIATQSTYIVPSKLNELPQELLEKIFSYLSKNDLQAVACVNWDISERVNQAASCLEIKSILNFIEMLSQRLNVETFSMQREQLEEISKKIPRENFENLILLKRHLLDVKAKLINVIKTLDPHTANDLRHHVQPPYFLENIFQLVLFERQIDEAIHNPHEIERTRVLSSISHDLEEAGNFDRAFEVATLLPDEIIRWNRLWHIFDILAQAGNFDKAIELVTSIPQENTRGFVLSAVSRTLAKTNNFDRAIEVGMSIPQEERREAALWHITEALTKTSNIDRAIQVATSISNEYIRDFAIWNVSNPLTEPDNIGSAIQVAISISDEAAREAVLSHICYALIEAGNIDKASKIASLMLDEDRRKSLPVELSTSNPMQATGRSLLGEIFKAVTQSCNIL